MAQRKQPMARSSGGEARYHPGGFFADGKVAEIGFDGNKRYFVCYDQNTQGLQNLEQIESDGVIYSPNHPEPDNLVETGTVLVPDKATEYGQLDDLILALVSHINKYVEVDEDFLYLSTAYILFTYRYSDVSNLGYIRVIGEFECGKSRYLQAVGRLCYLPCIFSTAPTDASIFRVSERYPGTLVIDEGDKNFSDTNSLFVKILNSGYQKEASLIRCSGTSFTPESFGCYGPKVLACRYPYDDPALESRLISYNMQPKTREDIPLLLGQEFLEEQKVLRQQLMMYRLKNLGTPLQPIPIIPEIGNRKNQIYLSISLVVQSETLIAHVGSYLKKAYKDEVIQRSVQGPEAELLHIISTLVKQPGDKIPLKSIAKQYNEEHDLEKMNTRQIGKCLRGMNLHTCPGTGNITCYEHKESPFKQAASKYGLVQ